MRKSIYVVKGKIESLKRVITRTENTMVTFMVGGIPCKAFGKGAEMMIRWVKDDPNSIGEFEGHFDGHSEKYGREFIATHGKLIETKTIDKLNSPDIASLGIGAAGAVSASEQSVPAEPIPASASVPAVVSAPVKPVTFEDLENEYKLLKMKHQMEKVN